MCSERRAEAVEASVGETEMPGEQQDILTIRKVV